MKMADILRDIADLLDQDTGKDSSNLAQNSTQKRLEPVEVKSPEECEAPVMVPPLQAKLEILKKSEGLPNVYDEQGKEDELTLMKKMAGISTAQKEASEDNDILG